MAVADLRIPLEDIILATNNFADEKAIGRSVYGVVYKGELFRTEGFVTVTFKRYNKSLGERFREFWTEFMQLPAYKHENLITLVGFCDEGNEKIIVHEFATNGSLDRYLNCAKLTWLKRLEICLGVARGLLYLHDLSENQRRFIHCDVNSTNILLDENWDAKIATLGSSKYDSGITMGNVDPVYQKTGLPTKESDIESFGVVLYQVLFGKPLYKRGPTDMFYYYRGKKLEGIDPILRKQVHRLSFYHISELAYECLCPTVYYQTTPRLMSSQVVSKLESALKFQQLGKILEQQKENHENGDESKGLQDQTTFNSMR